jgi:hypothetical protein
LLDFVTQRETYMRLGEHDAENRDFASAVDNVINEPRADSHRGGGQAVLFRANLHVVRVVSDAKPTTS